MNHYGADNEFSSSDPAGWDAASYSAHPIDSIEPLSDEPNSYRAAALHFLGVMYAIDRYMETAPDSRLAVVAIAIVLGWPSTRGMTVPEIAKQLGTTPATITRSMTKFREMSGLAAGVRFLGNGAGSSNGDKPAAVRA